MCNAPKLTPEQIDKLAAYGIRYPWMPQDVLKVIEKFESSTPPRKQTGSIQT